MSLREAFSSMESSPSTQEPRSGSPPIPQAYEPLHTRLTNCDPQLASPLFNGRIPPEVRNQIFHYALTPYNDPSHAYPAGHTYIRQGYTGPNLVTVSLLQTCRQIYLETYHIPYTTKEHVFWHSPIRGPPRPTGITTARSFDDEEKYFRDSLLPWQLALIKDLHLFTQLWWLEQVFTKLCEADFMQGITNMKITIARGDWWWNEQNHALFISPHRGYLGNYSEGMKADWEAEKRGQVIPWGIIEWGFAFTKLESLRTLELEFETSEDKRDELKEIVEHAKTWKFPMFDRGLVLSAGGSGVKEGTWQAPMHFWSNLCPYCDDTCESPDATKLKPKCLERQQLRAQNLGPKCHIFNVRYQAAKRDPNIVVKYM